MNIREAQVDLLVSYMSGGGAGHAAVKLRSQVQPKAISFTNYNEFSFNGDDVKPGIERSSTAYDENYVEGEPGEEREARSHGQNKNKFARTQSLTLDGVGAARAMLGDLPQVTTPHEILAELEFVDANGESATVSNRIPLWPSKLNLGIRTDGWA
ncbi:MAG: hypothetical protein IPP36_11360, partial [Nitrosomonadales bacterium]|nr:hypothetical protein [Nitrosomonadales bacterium]